MKIDTLRKDYCNRLKMYTRPTIIVEGPTDKVLFEKLILESNAQTIVEYPSKKIIYDNAKGMVIQILEGCLSKFKRANNYIGIIDTDFGQICGNPHNLVNLFYTDAHDIDSELFYSVFDTLINIYYWQPKNQQDRNLVKHKCIELAKEFGYYLLNFYINKKHSLKKEFIPIENFINFNNLTFSHHNAVKRLKELHKNGKIKKEELKEIKKILMTYKSKNLPFKQLANGHDLIRILCLLTQRYKMKLKKRTIQKQLKALRDDIEDSFRAVYGITYFKRTNLYQRIKAHQGRIGIIFIPE